MPDKSELPAWCAFLDDLFREGEIEEPGEENAKKEDASNE